MDDNIRNRPGGPGTGSSQYTECGQHRNRQRPDFAAQPCLGTIVQLRQIFRVGQFRKLGRFEARIADPAEKQAEMVRSG